MSLAARGFNLTKSLLHALDAERAHRLTIKALCALPQMPVTRSRDPLLPQRLMGLDFPNPLGLAPGFDKNAEVPDAMLAQGFGFVEVGTVTPLPQEGNPRPRLFRLKEDEAVINRMGFNNEGAAVVARRLDQRRSRGGIVGVNIGANKDAEDRMADYAEGVRWFGPRASYLTVNISSPNTPGLRNLQSRDELVRLLDRVNEARLKLPRRLPVMLKIAPDLTDAELADIAAVTAKGEVDAVIISNTTISRPPLRSRARDEKGGLSGRPLFGLSTRQLAKFHQLSGGKLPLVGVGGISDAETAWTKIMAGASLLQVYSALVFKGPDLVQDILDGIARKLREHHLVSLSEAVGLQSSEIANS
ncbi:MAG: quinone-dependent dihydroorotate dehydrogenase [Rhizobiales bacterium]|nr:quinone-dependent dihydroorotate dehydrogenase [Hyphomicrobiales bacterium]